MAEENKPKSDDCIQVVVRCRPQNAKEKNENRSNIITIDVEKRTVQINKPGDEAANKSYTFDGAFDENTLQKLFYEDCCFNLVENVLEGFNGTIFAYGQTGCGKSWTMQGPTNAGPDLRGVTPNAFIHIFDAVKATDNVQYLIHCSYLEIYNEEIKDLLANPKIKPSDALKCDVKEDPGKGVFVKNLTKRTVKNEIELQRALDDGMNLRTVASTQMNEESSRSHSIFTIVVEMSVLDTDTGKENIKVGKLNLVDLAGSERQKKTGASGAVLKEGAKINLSLSALGNVISALADAKPGKHVPYRDSKLTRLLQDSLGGNTKTLMVAAISPADYNWEETSSTLRYANRAKNIQNKPKINEDPKDTMMRELKEQVEQLKQMLAAQAAGSGGGGAPIALDVAPQQGENGGVREVIKIIENTADTDALRAEKAAMEAALAEERKKHEELMTRMLELQTQFTGHTTTNFTADLSGSGKDFNDFMAAASPVKTQEQSEEQKEAAARLKERRRGAKNKREAKKQQQLELARLAAAAAAEEMEELKEQTQGKVQEASQQVSEESRKRLMKMKRKFEKKLSVSHSEIDDILEEANYQRSQLLESLREQDKDCRLYESICLSMMTQKDLNKLIDKCRYDEEEEYWVVPYTKRKGGMGDVSEPSFMRSSNDSNMSHMSQQQQQQRPYSGQMRDLPYEEGGGGHMSYEISPRGGGGGHLNMGPLLSQGQGLAPVSVRSSTDSRSMLVGNGNGNSNSNSNSNSGLPGVGSTQNSRRGSKDSNAMNMDTMPNLSSGGGGAGGGLGPVSLSIKEKKLKKNKDKNHHTKIEVGGEGGDEYGIISFQRDFDDEAEGGGGVDMSSCGILPSSMNRDSNGSNGSMLPSMGGGGGGGGGVGKFPGVKKQPAVNVEDEYNYFVGDGTVDPGQVQGQGTLLKVKLNADGSEKKQLTAEEKEKKKRKKKAKQEKLLRLQQEQQQLQSANGGQDYTDEAGSGETAGVMQEWGWANNGAFDANDNDSDPAYSDDDDFVGGGGGGGGGGDGDSQSHNSSNNRDAHPPSGSNNKSKSTKAPVRKTGGGGGLPAL